jgi:putative CocE/NonD family hydrolase
LTTRGWWNIYNFMLFDCSRERCLGSLMFWLAMAALTAFAQQPPDRKQPEPGVDLLWGVKIPVRDGVKLNATIFKPKDQQGLLPVIFTFTPYIGDSYTDRALYFARNGYVYALVDVRGRGNSGGSFEPFANESRDGYDVVEWLARQPWSNGKVAMWGGSYAGFDQWSTAKEFPPHLATIVPAAAAHPGVDFPMSYNLRAPYLIQWLTYTSGAASNQQIFGTSAFWNDKFYNLYVGHLAFRELDRLVGNPSLIFQKWLDHPTPDAYLDAMVPAPDDYRRFTIPILTITGDYDADQPGAMTYYNRHMQYGTTDVKARHYLIIGPWDHGGTRTPKAEVGGLKFGPASVVDLNRLHRDWYDWTMKSGPKPEFLKERVAYYVMGAEKWKYARNLEAIGAERRVLYLDSDGSANDAFHSGSLGSGRPRGTDADHYVYDPLDIRFGALERKEDDKPLLSQRDALNLFGNGLVYHSAPFAEDTEVSGNLKLTVWLAMDVPDTDLMAQVYEIQADGTSIALTSAAIRARYRESLRQPKPVPAGEIVRYTFDNFTWFSRQIAKGSRLRLVFSCPNSIHLEKNYNSGGDVAEETAKDARTAHIGLYHDVQHASSLELPVVH